MLRTALVAMVAVSLFVVAAVIENAASATLVQALQFVGAGASVLACIFLTKDMQDKM